MELDPLRSPEENDPEAATMEGKNAEETSDHPDFAPLPMRPSNFDIFMLILSIVIHIVDIGTDINVAYQYANGGNYYYFVATVVIILVPALVNSCVSLRMYVMDMNEMTAAMNRKMWLRVVFAWFQLAPLVRYCDSLRFAIKSRKAEKAGNKEEQRHYYMLMLKEDADLSLLRVFESFLESAPQQILQITFLLRQGQNPVDPSSFSVYHQIYSITSSLVGMAVSLVTYQRNIRFTQENKNNISQTGSACIFFWHFFVTVSRIFMISAVASLLWSWTLISLSVHWITMTLSLSLLESHEFCSSPMFENTRPYEHLANFLFSAVLGLVYIFTYITPGEGSTCCRYSSFYTICFVENIVGVVLYLLYVEEDVFYRWYFVPLIVASVIPFIVGCFFMMLYYSKFHPSQYTPPSIMPQRRPKSSNSKLPLPDTPSPNTSNSLPNGDTSRVNCNSVQDIKTPS